MRIAFFAWEYPPRLVGGLGTYAEYITRDLVRMGADVVVLTENTGTLKTSEVVHGVEVHRPLNVDASGIMRIIADGELQSWGDQLRFFSAIFTNDVLCTAKFVNSLIRMEHVQFDMVCVHDWMGGMAASIIKAETDLPVVFHVHSTEWGRSRGEGSKVVNDIEYHTSAIADRIITVSYSMKEDLVRHGWPGEKIFVVWNGVDPEVYSPESVRPHEIEALRAKYGIADDEKMLLFVGRLELGERHRRSGAGDALHPQGVPEDEARHPGHRRRGGEYPQYARPAGHPGPCDAAGSNSSPNMSASSTTRRPTCAPSRRCTSRLASSASKPWPWRSLSW